MRLKRRTTNFSMDPMSFKIVPQDPNAPVDYSLVNQTNSSSDSSKVLQTEISYDGLLEIEEQIKALNSNPFQLIKLGRVDIENMLPQNFKLVKIIESFELPIGRRRS